MFIFTCLMLELKCGGCKLQRQRIEMRMVKWIGRRRCIDTRVFRFVYLILRLKYSRDKYKRQITQIKRNENKYDTVTRVSTLLKIM